MATYAEKLLADGEAIVLRERQHPISFISDARKGWLLWVLAVLLIVAVVAIPQLGQAGLAHDIVSLLIVVCLLLGVVDIAWNYLLWWTEEYLVTNRRLMKVSGVINKRSADSSLEKINDAILSQGFWGRMFNYGDLDILTAAESTVDSYKMLNAAPEFKKTMLNEKHALEMELAGHPISAPLRAERPMPPADRPPMGQPPMAGDQAAAQSIPGAPMPSAAPPMAPAGAGAPPPPPPVDSSLEVTQTLARLADLRDKGAITPQEYEAKKAELLSRL